MKRVLIANRGEIAVRIARACDDNNLESVAIYSDPDADALHVRSATEAYALQGSNPADTYLNVQKIIEIARRSGSDAVHPGYGFLSESADFADAVIDAGLTWIGPPPEAIRTLGDKLRARSVAIAVGAPLAMGSDGPVTSSEEVAQFGEQVGFPVLVKAAHGGGGRGMKVVKNLSEVDEAFDSAVREAIAAFGRGECFVEKFLEQPRHVEAQIAADQHGNVLVLGTRDCSVQRRNQKLIEEAPAPFVTEDIHEQIRQSAAAICRHVGYVGVGTVEYLLDRSGTLSFLEVNTRLQVEHPVTEETSGIDIVALQFAIAKGEKLDLEVDADPTEHAIEFRINAEDPGRGFLPSPGMISRVEWPTGPGIRVDSGVTSGSLVPAEYDSLIAKIIVTGKSREQAIRRAKRALRETTVEGIATSLPFHLLVLEHEDFISKDRFGCYTSWIETHLDSKLEANKEFSFFASQNKRARITIELDGKRVTLGVPHEILGRIARPANRDENAESQSGSPQPDSRDTKAPSSGILVKWLVKIGDEVHAGDPIAVLEAMKMESQVLAQHGGTVTEFASEPGDQIHVGDVILRIA